jgi:hypothetical protein
MKRFVIFLFILFIITGCSSDTTDQEEKSDYLAWKSELVEQDNFSSNEELNCDITVSVGRVSDDVISYTTFLSNPGEDMHSIKMMVVHNYFTEDVFPTIGIFDDTKELLEDDDNNITLVGYIDTTQDIQKLNLELRIWIEYTDNDGNIKDIYYKTTK